MSFIFGSKPKLPEPIAQPAPVAPPAPALQAAGDAVGDQETRRRKRRRTGTVLTGESGAFLGQTAGKTLLGE